MPHPPALDAVVAQSRLSSEHGRVGEQPAADRGARSWCTAAGCASASKAWSRACRRGEAGDSPHLPGRSRRWPGVPHCAEHSLGGVLVTCVGSRCAHLFEVGVSEPGRAACLF